MATTTERGLVRLHIEALSDGIFAFAMTLLILDVKIPSLETGSGSRAAARLVEVAPRFLVYAMSFLIVGEYWVGHHAQLHFIRRTDRAYLWSNLFYLMAISSLPFSAGLLGQYPRQPIAIIIYCVTLSWPVSCSSVSFVTPPVEGSSLTRTSTPASSPREGGELGWGRKSTLPRRS